MRSSLVALMLVAAAGPAVAQLPPVRRLGPITATSLELLGTLPSVRALSGGRVLVSDATKRRLVLFDSTLRNGRMILEADGSATGFPQRGGTLIAGRGDTTLFFDGTASSFLAIEPDGKVGRVISVPRSSDARFIATPLQYGQPMLDPAGRLVYRTELPPKRTGTTVVSSDSGPVIRVDFDKRTADTIGFIKVPPNAPRTSQTTLPDGTQRMMATPPPFEIGDEWAMLPDGSVALIRGSDYHVDWIAADGARQSSPKTAWNWKRLSDDDKLRLIDSLLPLYARADTALTAQMMVNAPPAGRGVPRREFAIVPVAASEVPDYPPPFATRLTQVDQSGRIWIPERGLAAIKPVNLVYDVIDRTGQIVDRVEVPAPYHIVGFGTDGSVYLAGTAEPNILMMVIGPSLMSGAPIQPPTRFARARIK